jgi:hypothetical protein
MIIHRSRHLRQDIILASARIPLVPPNRPNSELPLMTKVPPAMRASVRRFIQAA